MTRRSLVRGSAAVAGLGLLAPGPARAQRVQGSARAAGFYAPIETEPHERSFLQWPVNTTIHDDPDFLHDLQGTIATIANTIAAFEPVVLMAARAHHKAIRRRVSAEVALWDIPTDDLWCRDSGPSFVVDGKGGLAVTQFNLNGWGGKQTHAQDGQIAARVAERLGLPVFDRGLVGEAGGVETDGKGTLIAHESSFINPNRNRGSKAEITAMLLETMGAETVIWAPGIKGADITDYHIDALARFVRPGEVLIQIGAAVDPDDPWSVAAFETRERLAAATDARGQRLKLVQLPEPQDIRVDSPDFVSSYVNYYVCNGAVIAAGFGDAEADAEAADTLARLYPDREIILLNIDPLGEVGGGIHCATHEQPKV
ncbi:MAG: agmatine deiminase family protein [Gemmobacter sp.]|uniref:agmatine deiminase family protein n=1 Tax=Gemmobacter sp. TaxID=1898957 RepID=UPI001A63941D|nr:agmatine deiminase family protein [Gemmobacter sp.]MBL8563239.1 agmatine deiminase family protein [Gemmobacter sp.]